MPRSTGPGSASTSGQTSIDTRNPAWLIVSISEADLEKHTRPMARRYLGPDLGDRYVEQTSGDADSVLVRMRPERWLTVDYSKQFDV